MQLKLDNDDYWLAAMVVAEYSDLVRLNPHKDDPANRAKTIERLDRLAEKLMEIRFATQPEPVTN